jgi:Rieske Fe-S protein
LLNDRDEERGIDRRRFLRTAGAASILVAGGHWLGSRVEANRPAIPPLEAGSLDDLAAGEARAIANGDGTALAVRLATGDLVAFDRRCPHLGCPVVWAAARERFECPCHDAAFDGRTGAVLFGPPRRGLDSVAIRS